jgi:hypothetical protein
MENENFELRRLMNRVGWVIALCMAVLVALSLLASCTTTKYVEVERVRYDTTYVTKWQKDSVWLHDSVLVKDRGDTVLIEKWHTEWRDRLRVDTLYKATHDTIPQPYPVTEYVEKELSWWQQLRLWLGNVLLAVLAGAAVYGVIRIKGKLF